MHTDIQIRPAGVADHAAIQACATGAYTQYIPAIGKPPAPMLADFAALIAAGHVHVAQDSAANVLGYIVFFQQGDQVLLENVAVSPDRAGTGIGKALIHHCETTARHMGARAITLYTNEKMTDNLSLYPHLGYRETGRKTEHGFNRVYFEKTL